MNSEEDYLAIQKFILDRRRPVRARLDAIDQLVAASPAAARDIILILANRHDEEYEVLRAAGHAINRILDAGVVINQFDMRDMSQVAFEAIGDDSEGTTPN